MIHWSHFAGSLWDSVLAAHVHTNNLADQALAFNAAVDEFLTNTFTDIGEHLSVSPHRRCHYVRLCFENLILMARRATITSLQVENRTSNLLQIAITPMAYVREHGWDSTEVCLFRHQLVTTLAASLHLLSSALFSDQSIDDLSLRRFMQLGKAEFGAAVDLLSALTRNVPLAQRVLSDFERIMPLLRRVFATPAEDTSLFEDIHDWTIFGGLISPNAAELLPYREQVPDIRFPILCNGFWATDSGSLDSRRGVPSWEAGMESGGERSSVLWV